MSESPSIEAAVAAARAKGELVADEAPEVADEVEAAPVQVPPVDVASDPAQGN